jgi:hypothetical protein
MVVVRAFHGGRWKAFLVASLMQQPSSKIWGAKWQKLGFSVKVDKDGPISSQRDSVTSGDHGQTRIAFF